MLAQTFWVNVYPLRDQKYINIIFREWSFSSTYSRRQNARADRWGEITWMENEV